MQTLSIEPADRVQEIQEYYFSRKLREIARLNDDGADIISLGIGGPDKAPAYEVIDTLATEARHPDNHSYQPYAGIPQLRTAMAGWYKRWYGVTLDPATEIQPLIGSKEGILHISMAFLNPGDYVLIPNPGYPTYSGVSRLVGANILTYDLKEANGWLPDFKQLEHLATRHRIKLMWINYPNMPTGAAATTKMFHKIVDFGRRHSIVIAHDNPYSFILNDRPLSLLQTTGAMDIAVEMNSLSKSHNMAGWRVGMVASNAQFINWILKVKSNIDSGQFRPLMLAAVKALELPPSWYERVNEEYKRRRIIAERIMDALNCRWETSQRGLFLWGRIPAEAESSEQYADLILNEAKVFITPGFIFGSNGDRYVRISLCATEERLHEALERITHAMDKLRRKGIID